MARRFQFSLRALLGVMLAVAIACAIPAEIRVAIVIGAVWVLFCLRELLLRYVEPRNRANETSKEGR
ncbi:MAG TPA: hypothetical protein VHD36_20010 [Pirellulales bacterium]|nr:hypothetical protein [Pirellulales bacterium]HWB14755.1 hypothetical protein [Pirellulales bacterium]